MTYSDLQLPIDPSIDERLAEHLAKAESHVTEAKMLLETATRKYQKAKAEHDKLEARIGRISQPAHFLVAELAAASARADAALNEQQKLEKELRTAEGHRDELQLAKDQLDGLC